MWNWLVEWHAQLNFSIVSAKSRSRKLNESICTPTRQCEKSTNFLTFLPTLDVISLLSFANLMANRQYLVVILICISLITASLFTLGI